MRVLDLNGGGIKIDIAEFFGKMHLEDYLDREASLETYFEWKPISEAFLKEAFLILFSIACFKEASMANHILFSYDTG